jgi:hypothetical protein
MAFYERGRKEGDFETGIQQVVARVLVAPRFVFRMEDEPAARKTARPIVSTIVRSPRDSHSSCGAVCRMTSYSILLPRDD